LFDKFFNIVFFPKTMDEDSAYDALSDAGNFSADATETEVDATKVSHVDSLPDGLKNCPNNCTLKNLRPTETFLAGFDLTSNELHSQ
jgi:hypothetical protein